MFRFWVSSKRTSYSRPSLYSEGINGIRDGTCKTLRSATGSLKWGLPTLVSESKSIISLIGSLRDEPLVVGCWTVSLSQERLVEEHSETATITIPLVAFFPKGKKEPVKTSRIYQMDSTELNSNQAPPRVSR